MNEVFGEFIEEFPLEQESLELSFMFGSRSTEQRWRNNRLSAHFIADYLSTFIQNTHIEATKSAVSYIANELLENAIKFNEESKHYQIKFGIYFLENIEKITIVIFTRNSTTLQRAEKFQAFIQKLLSADPQELYVQQIEKTAIDEHSETSGLGLLTIINDYSAKLGWKFVSEPNAPQIITITTMAQVVV